MSTVPARRGRPTRASNAELELIALRGTLIRTVLEMAPVIKQQTLRASWHGGAKQAESQMLASLARLTKAASASTDL